MSTGKEIHIYDDAVPLVLRDSIFSFISGSLFRIGWADGSQESAIKHKFMYSKYSTEDNKSCGLLPFLQTTPINEHIKDLNLSKSIVNLSFPSEVHFAHAHPEKKGCSLLCKFRMATPLVW